ncbi:unnamed protein product [Caenorhabditis bovis]|uniref:Winged helix Storkhead-box1 domain-containing protein n=1 Tax=Caenorhabditis bovis TaxID=2654633 RepID=A0A8S1EX05_9PELO|nr:unnamed protein product [Caenorhabditis bovis]
MSCLAVVLDGPKAKNGRRVFESFVEENKMSFWNRDLVAASASLIYMGFMRPGTLFISGETKHLTVLKDAWARRLLKPAAGYKIASLGDLGAIQQVEQMHFVPLGDVICDAIAQLNRAGQPATETSIRQHVARHCAHVAPPGVEMVRQTLSSLLATGFIYKMGEHYFVAVPTNSPPKQKNTVECQTGTSIITQPKDKESKSQKKGIFARLFSRGMRPTTMMPPVNPQPVAFNPAQCLATLAAHPVPLPPKNKFPTYHEDLKNECRDVKGQKRAQRRRRREARLLSSSSECLNYGPIDPPELLPGCVEVVDDLTVKRQQKRRPVPKTPMAYPPRREAPTVRTSTPIESDSAYSPSPVTDSNDDDVGSHSDPEVNHTYINLCKLQNNDSTQFEDLTCTTDDQPQILASQMRGVLISNL